MRKAQISRVTGETDITVGINLDGTGEKEIDTGIGFFDHMLDQIARHGMIDLSIKAKGDLEVDGHHTVEDVGIALGDAIAKALADKAAVDPKAIEVEVIKTTGEFPATVALHPEITASFTVKVVAE